jgi:hypothetical protein
MGEETGKGAAFLNTPVFVVLDLFHRLTDH